MKKLLMLLVVLLLALGAGWWSLGSLIASALEHAGEYALQVPTKVGGATLAPTSGHVRITGLDIANPPGFASEHFVELRVIEANVQPSSLLGDVVKVDSIIVEGLDVDLELSSKGTNYGKLLDALERFEKEKPKSGGSKGSSKGGDDAKKGTPESAKRLVIGEFVLRDIRVHAQLANDLANAANETITLHEVRLKDLGGEEGLTLAEVVAKSVEALLQASIEAGGSSLPRELTRDLEKQLGKLGDDLLQRLRKDLAPNLEKLGERAKGALDDVGHGLEKIFK